MITSSSINYYLILKTLVGGERERQQLKKLAPLHFNHLNAYDYEPEGEYTNADYFFAF